jgi:hypothetical protein
LDAAIFIAHFRRAGVWINRFLAPASVFDGDKDEGGLTRRPVAVRVDRHR